MSEIAELSGANSSVTHRDGGPSIQPAGGWCSSVSIVHSAELVFGYGPTLQDTGETTTMAQYKT